ncbi:MAG: GNAT family N-acetyltransferase [Alphaproteobacteria bacterium]|nr:GNAT family N-acetyltransferase [Alphaproteobacteria bacterium]
MSDTALPGGSRLRLAGVDDAASLAALKIACWRESYADHLAADLLAELETSPYHDATTWRARLAVPGPHDRTYLVEDGDRAIGMMSLGTSTLQAPGYPGEVRAIYLLRDFQGRGIGTVCVQLARATLRRFGLTPVAVSTFAFNVRAIALYERLGARRLGRATVFEHGGVAYDEIILGWPD